MLHQALRGELDARSTINLKRTHTEGIIGGGHYFRVSHVIVQG